MTNNQANEVLKISGDLITDLISGRKKFVKEDSGYAPNIHLTRANDFRAVGDYYSSFEELLKYFESKRGFTVAGIDELSDLLLSMNALYLALVFITLSAVFRKEIDEDGCYLIQAIQAIAKASIGDFYPLKRLCDDASNQGANYRFLISQQELIDSAKQCVDQIDTFSDIAEAIGTKNDFKFDEF